MNPRVTDGPALLAAAAAVRTNRPAAMMAPIPSVMRSKGPSVRFNPWWASASARSWSTDLIAKSGLPGILGLPAGRGAKHRDGRVDHHGNHQPPQGVQRQRLDDEVGDEDRRRA